jgi:hypothetical protein
MIEYYSSTEIGLVQFHLELQLVNLAISDIVYFRSKYII